LQNGYKTAGYGKILHWDGDDKEVWSEEHYDANWGKYSRSEGKIMNATITPDKTRPLEMFKDYELTTRAVQSIRKLHRQSDYFMVGIGFKLPHVPVHIPHKYFEMYRSKKSAWNQPKSHLKFPDTSPILSYKCCAVPFFRYMANEGAENSKEVEGSIEKVNFAFTQRMHTELMWGYSAAVTFLDAQIGRLLDVVDELELWNNLTIVLTSDHGMHNGEKGIW
jgi:iduronate 2-sulfatase